MYRQCCSRLNRKVKELEARLASYTAAKLAGGRLSEVCFVHVFLASSVASGRALAQSFRDSLGPEGAVVGRASMEGIRDAWVELYKPMVSTRCADMVAEGDTRACPAGRAFTPVLLFHCQGEFDVRLRSGDPRDRPKVPRRCRASKVQQHVLRFFLGHNSATCPASLKPSLTKRLARS